MHITSTNVIRVSHFIGTCATFWAGGGQKKTVCPPLPHMHEWMEPYSHHMAQWRYSECSGTWAQCVSLDRSLMPTYSHAVVCMNEWNRIPITWLSDATPNARGPELSASRWIGPVAYAHLLACGWMNWIVNPRRRLLRSWSILLKCPFDMAIFRWQKESKYVSMITDNVFSFINALQIMNFVTWITAEHGKFHEIQSLDIYRYAYIH